MTTTTAGAGGLVRTLFLGAASKPAFLPFPEPDAETRETADEIFEMVSSWAADAIDPAAIDAAGEIPAEVREGLAELGLLGLIVPEEYGGAGMGQVAYSRLMEALAGRCASTVTVVGGHMGLAMKPVLLFGTDEQKARWLPRFASGEELGSFALTEANAGSDAGGLRATAVEQPDGSWVLSGTKVMITNAGFATVFAAFARTPDPERPDLPQAEWPISCFYVPAAAEGVTVAPEEDKMGLKGSSTCEVAFDEVRLPADHLIGPRGKGFKVALITLNTGRHGLAACCIGQARLAADLAYKQAGERVQFGRPIAEFGLVREMLAGMRADIYAMESGTYLAAGLIDRGETDYLLESAACKIFATERLWTLANDALQVAGGWGFFKEFPFERIVRDARINLIFEGTNQILRTLMAGQGLKPLLAGGAPEPADRATPEDFHGDLHGVAAEVLAAVEELGRATAELLESKGKGLFFDQPAQARISEASVALYTALAVLSRATGQLGGLDGEPRAALADLARLAARRRLRAARASLGLLRDPDSELEARIVERAYP